MVQQPCRLQCRMLRQVAAGEPMRGHARRRVEKSQIVMVDVDALSRPASIAHDVTLGGTAELRYARHLVREPQHAGPESVGPLDIADRLVDAVDARWCREAIAKDVEIALYPAEHS